MVDEFPGTPLLLKDVGGCNPAPLVLKIKALCTGDDAHAVGRHNIHILQLYAHVGAAQNQAPTLQHLQVLTINSCGTELRL